MYLEDIFLFILFQNKKENLRQFFKYQNLKSVLEENYFIFHCFNININKKYDE